MLAIVGSPRDMLLLIKKGVALPQGSEDISPANELRCRAGESQVFFLLPRGGSKDALCRLSQQNHREKQPGPLLFPRLSAI
ncbi:MAG: hypothetical protein ACTFAK_16260 [Candidatus Electronema sp. VV]